jgi:hypothetical protein
MALGRTMGLVKYERATAPHRPSLGHEGWPWHPAVLLRALAVIGTVSCSNGSSAPADTADAADPVLVPQLASDWVTIATNPLDLGTLGTPTQEQVDFGIWQASDATWQLWECIRNTNAGGPGGYGRLFYRWQGADLVAPAWTPMGIALQADPTVGERPGGLQAPYVVKSDDGAFQMFYGSWDAIAHARSEDGKSFTRVLVGGSSTMFSEPPPGDATNTRDPMVLRIGAQWRVYYAATENGVCTDFVRGSTDLQNWGPSTVVARGSAGGDGPFSAECPFVVPQPSGWYYLFRTYSYTPGHQRTAVFRSRDPNDFGIDAAGDAKLVTLLPIAAPEIVSRPDGLYIAALLDSLHGVRVAKLQFAACPAGDGGFGCDGLAP